MRFVVTLKILDEFNKTGLDRVFGYRGGFQTWNYGLLAYVSLENENDSLFNHTVGRNTCK